MNHYPDTIIPEIKLTELIDIDNVRLMMESFYDLTGIPMSLTDCNDTILAGAGWQEICTRFHRTDPRTEVNCIESGTSLIADIPEGEFRLYKCRNGMWDMATPLYFGKLRIGYLFSGQFFFKDEKPDRDFFIQQAAKYNFDVNEYMDAFEKVPRVERSYIEKAEAFFIKLAATLAEIGFNKLKLEKALEDTRVLLATSQQNKFLLEEAQSIAHLGSWELDLKNDKLTWSAEVYRICGIDHLDFDPTFEGFLSVIHPDDKEAVSKAYLRSIYERLESYEIEHRIVRNNTGEIRWVHEKCNHLRDRAGNIVRSVGMVHDITERKRAEIQARELRNKLIKARNHFRRGMFMARRSPQMNTAKIVTGNKKKVNDG